MLSLSKQFDKFLRSFRAGQKYLTWKARSELAELGNEISRRKGFLKDASRSNTQVR